MKLSTGQVVVIAAGGGLALWALAKGSAGDPFGLYALGRTVMPNPPNQLMRANNFAARAGSLPSQAGYNGIGATSVQPVFAGTLAGLGSFVGQLFRGLAGPGNTANANRPQSSASSGGGIAQPSGTAGVVPGWQGDWSDFGMSDFTDMFTWDTQFDSAPPTVAYAPGGYGDTSFDPFAGFEQES